MFLGHYGVALAAKSATRRTSLGTLILAAQFADLLWPALLLADVEEVRIQPGLMEASALDFVHYPWSHSLLMIVVWAVLFGLAYRLLSAYPRGAWLVGGLVLSHWLLDAPFHRPDLPLWPGSDALVGGGLWDSVPATLVLELGLLALGVSVYVRVTRPIDRIGTWGLWMGIALLVAFWLGSFAGPPPDPEALAWGGLTLWLLVLWGWFVDRHRAPQPDLLSDH